MPTTSRRLVTPAEVQEVRDWLDPFVNVLSQYVTDNLPENVRSAWQTYALGWARYCATPPSWAEAPSQLNDGKEFARILLLWKKLLSPAEDVETNGVRLVDFWTSSDEVKAIKNRIDPYVVGLDQAVATCRTVPADMRTNWTGFVTRWQEFRQRPEGWFDNSRQLDEGRQFERDLYLWQRKLAVYGCSKSGPDLEPTNPEKPEKPEKPKQPSEWAGTIGTVAVAGAVIAGLVFAGKFAPSRSNS